MSVSPSHHRHRPSWSRTWAAALLLGCRCVLAIAGCGIATAAEPVPPFTVEKAMEELEDRESQRREPALRFLMSVGEAETASIARILSRESPSGAMLFAAVLEAASSDDDDRALAAVLALNRWSDAAEAAVAERAREAKSRHHERVAAHMRSLGGTVFLRDRAIVEVVLNGCRIVDTDLRGLRGLREITDLSLERTPIGNGGLRYVADLVRLEWLNLFLTQVGDEGLVHLKKLRRLERLPLGGTRVTDAGLKFLGPLVSLKYLGLRGTRISDGGLPALAGLAGLTELNLSDTAVSDAGLESIASMKSLRVLYLGSTATTDAGIVRLSRALPECAIRR